MAKKNRSITRPAQVERFLRRRGLPVGTVLLCLVVSAAVLAWRGSSGEPAPPMQGGTPALARENIFAGGRLLATEEPDGPVIGNLVPDTGIAGGGAATVDLFAASGTTFEGTEVVRFASRTYTATYTPTPISSTQLRVTFDVTAMTDPGYASITVYRGATKLVSRPATFTRRFVDVEPTHPYYTYINKIATIGVTVGCGSDAQGRRLYCANDAVTRGQMAAFIIRALGSPNPPDPPGMRQLFTDVPPSHPFYKFIDEMATRGITLGCTPMTYCPDDPVLHEQMAAFITRALGLPGASLPVPTAQRFADVPIPPAPANPFYKEIEEYARRGIWLGGAEVWNVPCSPAPAPCPPDPACAPGNFCPSYPVRRYQMAKILVTAFNF